MAHLYDLTAAGLGLVMNDLGTIDTASQIANYTVASSATGLKNLRDIVIPALIDPTLTGANEDFSALTAFQSSIYNNETAGLSAVDNLLLTSCTAMDTYFTKQYGVKTRTYISNNDTNGAFLIGGSGAILGTVTTAGGAITNITITNGGIGYNTSCVVSVTIGTGAIITPTVNGSGTITGFSISGTMSGYTGSSTATVAAAPLVDAPYRFLYGRVMNDEFVFQVASRSYNGSVWSTTTGTNDLLNLYGNSILNIVVGNNSGNGFVSGTVYNVTITGLLVSSTGLSAGTVSTQIGSLSSATISGSKIAFGTSGVKYECAQTRTSGGPYITPISITVTTLAGGTSGDNFYITTV